jgi:HEAT repeat protein
MKTLPFALLLLPFLAIAELDLDKLEQALAAAASYTPGDNANTLKDIDKMVATVADSATRKAVEAKLLAALPKAQTADSKGHICRLLYYVGGKASIAPLAEAMQDAEIAQVARRSLAVIPGSGDALLEAMPKLDEAGQIGCIIALGDQKHEPARETLAVVLASANSAKVAAAAGALGQLGGPKSVKALQGARVTATGAAARAIDAALLRCAAALEPAAAKPIYEAFFAEGQASNLRVAGLTGLARVSDDPGKLLTEAIKGEDRALASHAIRVVADGEGTIGPLLALLPTLGVDTQALLIRALAARDDSTLAAAIVPFVQSQEEAPRRAAIEALGQIGDAASLHHLLGAAVISSGDERNLARASLESLPVDNSVLIRAMNASNSASQEELIRTLAARRAAEAADMLITIAAGSDNDDLRREALRGLRKLVDAADLPRYLQHLAEPKAERDRGAWGDLVADAIAKLPTPEAQAKPILAALITAEPAIQGQLLPILAKPATVGALATVRESLKSEDEALRDGAIRALTKWPNSDVADDLLSIITSSKSDKHRILATRGYLDLARTQKDSEAMYAKALDFAKSAQDRKTIIAGLGGAKSLSAFNLVAPYLDDQLVAPEAALALVEIGQALDDGDVAKVRPVIDGILDRYGKDAKIAKGAAAILGRLEQFDHFIVKWEAIGPFTADDYPKALAAEHKLEGWQPLTKGVDHWQVNAEQAFGGGSNRYIYLRATVTMEAAAEALLESGSDDGCIIWLNDEKVHEFKGNRGVSRGSDKTKVSLKAGGNTLVAKVVNDGGGWGFCARFRAADGRALKGLSLE